MVFSDIIGQEKAIKVLRSAIEKNRVSHSYIFFGPEGVGKRTTALLFAQALNCKDNKFGCGVCDSCKSIYNYNNLDVKIITKQDNKTNITLEQIKEVQKSSSLRPLYLEKKVYIIDEASDVSIEGANSLLKILEEPQENVVIILVTTKFYFLLPTIKSRCQKIEFFPLKLKNIVMYLKKKYNINFTFIEKVSKLSQGSLGKAIRFIEEKDTILMSQRFKEVLEKGNIKEVLEFTAQLEKEKKNRCLKIIEFLILIYQLEFERNPESKIKEYLEKTLELKGLIERNINPRLAIEQIFLSLIR